MVQIMFNLRTVDDAEFITFAPFAPTFDPVGFVIIPPTAGPVGIDIVKDLREIPSFYCAGGVIFY